MGLTSRQKRGILQAIGLWVFLSLLSCLPLAIFLRGRSVSRRLEESECFVHEVSSDKDVCVVGDEDDAYVYTCYNVIVSVSFDTVEGETINAEAEIYVGAESEDGAISAGIEQCASVGNTCTCWYDPEGIHSDPGVYFSSIEYTGWLVLTVIGFIGSVIAGCVFGVCRLL